MGRMTPTLPSANTIGFLLTAWVPGSKNARLKAIPDEQSLEKIELFLDG